MTCETPYAMSSLSLKGETRDATEHEDQTSGRKGMRWSFPPLKAAPQSMRGEMILTSGALQCGGWKVAWAQIVGKKHRCSEDSMGINWSPVLTQEKSSCHEGILRAVMADGVGGGARGEIASHATVQHCLDLEVNAFLQADSAELSAGLSLADAAVNKALATVTTLPGAATLAAVWLNSQGDGWVSRVGDARISVKSKDGGNWQSVMADQSYANLGEMPPDPVQRHAPARMVGAGLMGQPEVCPFRLNLDEILMLSTDGCHEWLTQSTRIDVRSSHISLADLARDLVLQARDNGSDDDISVLLVRRGAENSKLAATF